MNKRPRLYWTLCAAHCIDLILEDIGKVHLKTVAKARRVVVFMYKHALLLHHMRKAIGGNLIRPAITRFATAFFTLQSLYGKREELRSFVTSAQWRNGAWAKKAEGKWVAQTILTPSFWNGVAQALRDSQSFAVL
eukprot:TRINITY_DN16554_c0_g1_i3.p1 TRINITY_DN16554_c0_g1~~TRINITY_DN16554_c0_g1_i3.p1  ORF type:complete len:135 (-),score=2.23 TRINITY_DN16554_c0_g1_i3:56-460(-)